MPKVSFPLTTFQTPSGAPVANGFVLIALSEDCAVWPSGGLVVGSRPQKLKISLDANGTVLGNPQVWPNDILAPTGSYYTVEVYKSDGQRIAEFMLTVISPTQFISAIYNYAYVGSTEVSLSVLAGDLVLILASADGYAVGGPVMPGITDNQGNIYTTDTTFPQAYIGGTGDGFLLCHTFAQQTGTLTVTPSAPSGYGTRILMVVTNAPGIDGVGIQAEAIAVGSVSPSATATASNQLALVLDYEASNEWTSNTGTQLYRQVGPTGFAHVWGFTAVVGVNTVTVGVSPDNFSVGAIAILKNRT